MMSWKRLLLWLPLWFSLMVLLMSVGGGLVRIRKATDGELAFNDASSYRDMFLAEGLLHGNYGSSSESPAPARLPLWHAVVASGRLVGGSWPGALLLVGILAAIGIIFCMPALCRAAGATEGWNGGLVAVVWIVAAPGLLLAILGGYHASLAALFSTLALLMYLRSLKAGAAPGILS